MSNYPEKVDPLTNALCECGLMNDYTFRKRLSYAAKREWGVKTKWVPTHGRHWHVTFISQKLLSSHESRLFCDFVKRVIAEFDKDGDGDVIPKQDTVSIRYD